MHDDLITVTEDYAKNFNIGNVNAGDFTKENVEPFYDAVNLESIFRHRNSEEVINRKESLKSFIFQNLDGIEKSDGNEVKLDILLEQKLAEQYLQRSIDKLKRK